MTKPYDTVPARIKPTITAGDHDPRHGTRNGYVNLACRCDSCTTAHSEYVRRRRQTMAAI